MCGWVGVCVCEGRGQVLQEQDKACHHHTDSKPACLCVWGCVCVCVCVHVRACVCVWGVHVCLCVQAPRMHACMMYAPSIVYIDKILCFMNILLLQLHIYCADRSKT